MSDIDHDYTGKSLILHLIGQGELDIRDVLNHPSDPDERKAALTLERMAEDIARANKLDPDEDEDEILDMIQEELGTSFP